MRRTTILAALLAVLLLAGVLSAGAGGDWQQAKEKHQGKTLYLQYNFYYDDDEADWMNYVEAQFLPPGTPVVVKKVKEEELILEPEGLDGKLEVEMDECEPSYLQVFERMLGEQAPSLDGLSEIDLEGIDSAEILVGMSRRAVFLAVGYPPYFHQLPFTDRKVINKDLEADRLTFAKGSWDVVHVTFKDDKVSAIDD